MSRHSLIRLIVLLAFLAGSAAGTPAGASSTITGRVLSSQSYAPLENANVFIAQTFCGTSTDTGGRFILNPDFLGSFDLVVSRVGYEHKHVRLQLAGGDTIRLDIRLDPRVIAGDTIQVVSMRPEEWERRLDDFLPVFIGPAVSPEGCTLVNPWVVDFRMSGDTLIASSDSMLMIENRAFGYHIRTFIGEFRWDLRHNAGIWSTYPSFSFLSDSSGKKKGLWEKNRRDQYLGSLRHFLRSCIRHRLAEEGFIVKTLRWAGWSIIDEDMIGLGRIPGTGLFAWRYPYRVSAEYHASGRNGILRLVADYALVDYTGFLVTPFAMEVGGRWGDERVGSMLPLEYLPEERP